MTKMLALDTVDDRREIRRLLDFMHPVERWDFLDWCATQCETISGKRPGIIRTAREQERLREAIRVGGEADCQLSNECYVHIWQLHVAWKLDLDATLAKLIELARGKDSRGRGRKGIPCSSRASSTSAS